MIETFNKKHFNDKKLTSRITSKIKYKSLKQFSHLLRLFIIFFITCFVFLQSISNAYANNDLNEFSLDSGDKSAGPAIRAPSAILFDAERGQILYQKNPDLKLHISVANKIMTAVLTIEKGNLENKVTISKESSSSEGSVLFLTVGEKYAVEDLLNAIILTNANDAANALAEYVGGDINKFVEMMNNKAKELKMDNTYFVNPTGLSDEKQYTTAADIAKLIRYALTLPDFNRIFSYRAVPWINSKNSVDLLTNSNKLFWSYDGVDGGKTGYNQIDKQSSITSATRSGRRLVAIVLDAPENDVLADSVALLDYGFNNFKKGILVSKNQALHSITVANKEINLISINDVYYTFPIGEDYVSNVEINITKDLNLPILKSRVIGIARYTLKDGTVINVNLYPDTDVYPPENLYTKLVNNLKEYKELYILVVILVIIEILIILYKIISKITQYFKKFRSKHVKTSEES